LKQRFAFQDSNMSDNKRTILVVEDEYALRKDIVEMLTFEGFDVLEAENGALGVDMARQNLPDLIICDIMMPELNGYQVLDALRQKPETQTIPFVFLTARTDKQDRRKGMDEGADDFLTKPFQVDDLLNTIRIRLEKHEQIMAKGGQRVGRSIIMSLPHELRTPLTVILGFSDILMADYQTMEPPRVYEMAEHINKAALRLYHLVENYLVYAQLEIGSTDTEILKALANGNTSQPHLIIETHAMEKAQSYGRTNDVQITVNPIARIDMRDDLLRKLVEELVDNALKFSAYGTPVHIEVYAEGDTMILRISDHGRGMSVAQIARIGAYVQFDRQIYEQQGSGLGLVIAQRIAQLHRGSLHIDSQPNQLTTVVVRLPLPSGQ
jgi:two-component system sensor histidine kinase/response regulator